MTTKFLKVKCPDCGNEQTCYSRAATKVECLVCGTTLMRPTGGLATVKGEIVAELE